MSMNVSVFQYAASYGSHVLAESVALKSSVNEKMQLTVILTAF